jgi:hypothetical protein
MRIKIRLCIWLYVFCSGRRVGCDDLRERRRPACRYSGRLGAPESLRGLLGRNRRSVSKKAPLQNQLSE